jgi:hypothetical protein
MGKMQENFNKRSSAFHLEKHIAMVKRWIRKIQFQRDRLCPLLAVGLLFPLKVSNRKQLKGKKCFWRREDPVKRVVLNYCFKNKKRDKDKPSYEGSEHCMNV